MKVFRLEVMVIDEDVQDLQEAMNIVNNQRYPNHTNIKAVSGQEAEIGEWDDDNPLNNKETQRSEINRLFGFIFKGEKFYD